MDIPTKCPECGREEVISVDDDKFTRWHEGENIQNVFPEMPASRREQLITGLDDDCFNRVFGERE
jgi:hypothetical protein